MLSLLWTGLNLVLLLLVLYAWFRVLKVLRREIGLGLAVLFMLSMSFRGNNSSLDTRPKNLLATEQRSTALGNWSTSASVKLTPINNLHLIFEGMRTDSTVQASSMYATTSGLLLGHRWEPMAGITNPASAGLSYQVVMVHEWKLLGIGFYTSTEDYSGNVSAD
jgi:hypothetical protein